MAYIQPDTTVQFLNVPFDPEYENTMYWDTLSAQNGWMETRVILTIGNNSYQKKTRGVIRVGLSPIVEGATIRNLYNANYMRFKNSNYENKWFYAFVNQVEYVNNNTADVFYTIDVLQTWAFDYSLLECFIERQHTITDDIGEHTVPESVEHGEYFSTFKGSQESYGANGYLEYTPCVCLVTSFDEHGEYASGSVISGQYLMGNVFSGAQYHYYDITNAQDITDLNATLEAIGGNTADSVSVISKGGVKIPKFLVDGVIALFMMPKESHLSNSPRRLTFDVRTNGSYLIGTYRPRNKKLMCYPYNMLYISNGQGNSAEYKWEDFASPIAAPFDVWGNVAPNGGLLLSPRQYKSYPGQNQDESIQVTGFPLVTWTFDSFRAWLAQNAGTIGASAAGLIGSWTSVVAPWVMGGSSMAGNGVGSTVQQLPGSKPLIARDIMEGFSPSKGLIAATIGAMGQIYDHQTKPPQARGNGNLSLTYQAGNLTFWFYQKHIKEEYAKIIDAYFDMYGYKVNMVGVPNRNARPCYTYIKTIGCAVDGLIPADDAKQIQSIFDKGIRFWKTTATFGVYSPLVNPNEVTIEG